ncbi:MAG: hypothetical protein HYY36_00430 [Gammaproteobacteria bacterium]|nr:hypothetical protein [Gammaproteobacteria bacterium]
MLPRNVISAALLAVLFSHWAPVYACEMFKGLATGPCCCTPAALQKDSQGGHLCTSEPPGISAVCCHWSGTSQLMPQATLVQKQYSDAPDRLLHPGGDHPLRAGASSSESILYQYQERGNASWLWGTGTYLMTARLRN